MQPLSIQTQKALLAQCFPVGTGRIQRASLVWEGSVQPTAISLSYTIRVDYSLGELPKVSLLSPNAQQLADEVLPGRTLPHVYSHDHPIRLCVYHPSKREWKEGMPLATTVVPWTIMWLSYFEDWVITDVWSGGGEHPPQANKPERADAQLD
jgi:hypothetical protein